MTSGEATHQHANLCKPMTGSNDEDDRDEEDSEEDDNGDEDDKFMF